MKMTLHRLRTRIPREKTGPIWLDLPGLQRQRALVILCRLIDAGLLAHPGERDESRDPTDRESPAIVAERTLVGGAT